ncbi:MAG: DNA translocase FtsK 4TM domain-containing protein, partial [Planctomycetia bacterium]|nr:DNA translocase FtsK 4TM domain-containing protein [Planctomycetia bacterium]
MNKGEGKRKTGAKKRARKNKKQVVLSPSVSKEIVGLSMMGIGLLVMIGIFSVKSGLFGQLLRKIFVGLFGIGGYIIPLGAIVLGVFYIQGRFDKVYRLLVYGLSFNLMLIIFFHLLTYGEDNTFSLLSFYYLDEASWQNGGYIGALLGTGLLKLLGVYGTYVLLIVSYGIWMLLLTQFPIFSWINEQAKYGVGTVKQLTQQSREAKKAEKSARKLKTQTDSKEAEQPVIQIQEAPSAE